MTETDKLIHRVRSHLAQPGVTKAGLALRAGLHKNALRDADRVDWNPTADTLRKIEPHLPADDYAAAATDTAHEAIPSGTKSAEIIGDREGPAPRPFPPTSTSTSPSSEGSETSRPRRSSTGQPASEAEAA